MSSGGMENVVYNLAININKKKYDVKIFCTDYEGILVEKARRAGIKVDILITGSKNIIKNYWPSNLIYALRRFRPNIVHSHSGVWYKSAISSKILRIPVHIYTEHGLILPFSKKQKYIDKFSTMFTDKVVCVSKNWADYYKNRIGINKKKLIVINNGVDVKKYTPTWKNKNFSIRKKYNIAKDAIVLISVGSLKPIKGHKYLIKAFRKLVLKNSNIYLWLLGDGRKIEEYKHYVYEKKIQEKIHFFGFTENVEDYLQEADIFILPSLSEGTSIALLEAMASGLAIVATKVGGNIEVLDNGNAGILINPSNEMEIFSAIEKYIHNQELRKRNGINALMRVNSVYTCEGVAHNYENLYLRQMQKNKIIIND
jgi:glycosyltransferase involved in cell wall biosynthesis